MAVTDSLAEQLSTLYYNQAELSPGDHKGTDAAVTEHVAEQIETITAWLKKMSKVKRVEVYSDESGEWRWRAFTGNHKNVANCGEGYTELRHAQFMAAGLFPWAKVSEAEA